MQRLFKQPLDLFSQVIFSMYQRYGKRAIDCIFSIIGIIVLFPLLLITALAIYLEDRGPILFRQKRIGYKGNLFYLFKFRSMPVTAVSVPSAQAGQLKVTKVGKIIRRTNIDELPQLINILKGEMSLVGPRPALSAQIHLCELRLNNGAMDCLPGLTGKAQINSYNGMPEEEKARWDGIYASQVTLLTDLVIIAKTFRYITKPPPVY